MSYLICETCRQPGATPHPAGHFCRSHRPRPSLLELVDLAEAAVREGRQGDLLRLLSLLREAVEGRPAPEGERSRSLPLGRDETEGE